MCKRCDDNHQFKPYDKVRCVSTQGGEYAGVHADMVYTIREQLGQTVTLTEFGDIQRFDSKRFVREYIV